MENKHFSRRCTNITVILFAVLQLSFFLWITIHRVQAGLSSPFVSLEKDNEDSVCVEVPKSSIVGNFGVDINGNWDTTDAYRRNETMFYLQVPGNKFTDSNFTELIQSFGDTFQAVGKRAATRPYVWSLIAWSTIYGNDADLDISLVPDVAPELLFLPLSGNSMAPFSANGSCNDPANLRYDPSGESSIESLYQMPLPPGFIDIQSAAVSISDDGKSLTYPIFIDTGYYWNPNTTQYEIVGFNVDYPYPCPYQFSLFKSFAFWDTLNYQVNSTTGQAEYASAGTQMFTMNLKFDTRSIFVTAAVNMGIIPLSSLQQVESASRSIIYASMSGPEKNWKLYVHPLRVPMEPIACAKGGVDSNPFDYCVVFSQDKITPFYPAVYEITDSGNITNCENESEQYGFRVSLLYSQVSYHLENITHTALAEFAMGMAQKMKNDPENGDLAQVESINNLYDKCSLTNSECYPFCRGQNPDYDTLDPQCPAAWEEINASPLGMFTFYLSGSSHFVKSEGVAFTANGLTLREMFHAESNNLDTNDDGNTLCYNTFYKAASFQKMKSPPVQLNEQFYSCIPELGGLIKDSVGIAFGFVMLFVNGMVSVYVIFVIWWDDAEFDHKAEKPGSRLRTAKGKGKGGAGAGASLAEQDASGKAHARGEHEIANGADAGAGSSSLSLPKKDATFAKFELNNEL